MRRTIRTPAPIAALLVSAGLAACSSSPNPPPPDSCSNVPASALLTSMTFFVDPHYCMFQFATDLPAARQLAVAPNGDIFVVTPGSVIALFDDNDDGVSDAAERSTFATAPSLNHGLAVTATHVYASSTTTVYRWPYTSGDRTASGPMETVVAGIESGGHATRTLVIDSHDRLYVSIGSAGNVDVPPGPMLPPATRAQIRRYDLGAIPAGGYAASAGELFAAGLRNEVGLSIDSKGRMWGVENGRDNLIVGGEDIHYDNPAEEVNLFDINRPGRNYGYPSCWSEGIWMGAMAKGLGTQHLDPDQPGGFTETQCQDASVIAPPAFALPAHLAPLDVVEYRGNGYPGDMSGDLFVTSHGSWNREIAQVGRMIVRLKMGANGPTEAQTFLSQSDMAGGYAQGTWGIRPISIRVDRAGLLTFSSDASSAVYKIGYKP
jgi:glucose/arabinose dehydrogenase